MKRLIILIPTILILLLGAAISHAQSGSGYDLTWNTIDGGGGMFSTGGVYSLGGTISQPDAGSMSGGLYTLVGGFWGGITTRYNIYLPLILKIS